MVDSPRGVSDKRIVRRAKEAEAASLLELAASSLCTRIQWGERVSPRK
jgi:hypothetical protein